MSFISQKCIDQLTQQDLIRFLPAIAQWIAGREFKRVNDPAGVAAYDKAAQAVIAESIKNPYSLNTFSGGANTDAFANAIVQFFNTTARCPGWNESTCSFDWGEFACFCAAAVPMDPALIIELGKTQPADQPVVYTCDPKVKADPIYKTSSTGGPQPLVKDTPPTGMANPFWVRNAPWIYGGAAAVVLGVGGAMAYHHYKKSKNIGPARNPGRLSGKRRSIMPRYTLAELKKMPTIESGHFDNLMDQTPTMRVWLSRMTKADGMPYNNQVTIERLIDGVWTTVDEYQAR